MTTSNAEKRFRRVLLVSALVMVFGITLGFGWTMLSILDNLHAQKVAGREYFEQLVENQTDIIKRIALTNREVTRKNRLELRQLILDVEDDLRVILEELGGDPDDIPPQPEPSGANNPPPDHDDGNDEPDPKPTPKPTPKPSPTDDPLICLPPPVGCIERP